MCDTIVILPEATSDKTTLFGKNSDRDPNEAHHLLSIPASDHLSGSSLKCTYIEIPQVSHTFAVLLAKPFWIWGAEMGVNEHGVAIGNEAVFARIPYQKEDGLIGMDFLRLALERSTTARAAVTVITDLLATYGQGGNCGFQHKFYYYNSFLIADAYDAWVLETADRHWVAKQVKDIYTISNSYSIEKEWDISSPGVIDFAIEKGWCKNREDFNFSRCFSDFTYSTFSYGASRRCRTRNLLEANKGNITIADVMNTLRDHGENNKDGWGPDKGITGATVCMHAGFGPIRVSQTTGSMVSHLHPQNPTHFFTATAAPCTSIFKPVWFNTNLPSTGTQPGGNYDQTSLFWKHEALHRATMRNYGELIKLYQKDRDDLERRFIFEALKYSTQALAERLKFSTQCFTEAGHAEATWLKHITEAKEKTNRSWHHTLA